MSGGYFNYAYASLADFSLNLKMLIEEKPAQWDNPEVVQKLKDIADIAEYAARLAKEVEWLYSGDTGEETFLARVKRIEEDGPNE